MLEIRPTCEHCNIKLAHDSHEAVICSFECTFCKECASSLLRDVCPNCGGNFVERPIRPANLLEKYPPSEKIVFKPVDLNQHLKNIQS